MKSLLLASLLFLLFPFMIMAGNDKEYKYEIESYNGNVSAQSGSCIIKVWSYGKKEKVTRELCMKNAIHGILFKGYAVTGSRKADRGRKALVPEGYEAHKDYFDKFFDSGDFMQYVQLTNNGQLTAGDVIKISKREYKVGMVIIVDFDALRKRLENDKIIKPLNYLF